MKPQNDDALPAHEVSQREARAIKHMLSTAPRPHAPLKAKPKTARKPKKSA